MVKGSDEKSHDNSFGVASVVLGIMGIVSASLSGVSIVLGVIGLIFANKQNKIMKNKWASAGKILNIVSIVLGIILIIVLGTLIYNNPDFINALEQANSA